ncbi:HAD family hydrolase [Enterococcus sp. LJL128]
MSIVVFSDLDGTLLFSKNSLPKSLTVDQCLEAETYANGGHGYMERQLVDYLKQWSEKHLFIPVTTRSTEQYERLSPLLKELAPAFALTSNGGNLYRSGQLDLNWNQQIKAELKPELESNGEILRIIERYLPQDSIRKVKEIDNLYYCVLVVARTWEPNLIQQVNEELSSYGWTSYFQHKKLYFLPAKLSKEGAAAKLKAELPEGLSFKALGDTDMDQPMLKEQNHHLYFGTDIQKQSGIRTAEYSFEAVKKLLAE